MLIASETTTLITSACRRTAHCPLRPRSLVNSCPSATQPGPCAYVTLDMPSITTRRYVQPAKATAKFKGSFGPVDRHDRFASESLRLCRDPKCVARPLGALPCRALYATFCHSAESKSPCSSFQQRCTPLAYLRCTPSPLIRANSCLDYYAGAVSCSLVRCMN